MQEWIDGWILDATYTSFCILYGYHVEVGRSSPISVVALIRDRKKYSFLHMPAKSHHKGQLVGPYMRSMDPGLGVGEDGRSGSLKYPS